METLHIKNISKSFEDEKILDDISIELNKGELVSLLGASGSGKTTLFNVISGLTKPDSGQVLLDGEDITGTSGHIAYMLQKDLLMPHKTIVDNVALPLMIKGTSRTCYQQLPTGTLATKKAGSVLPFAGNKKEARELVAPYFAEFGLEGTEYKYPHQLSGGMRQRAALLRTYMFSKEIALLDEPFSALDTLTKGEMHRWYLDVMNKINLSTLFITHDIDEAILLSDRIYLLSGKPGTIKDEIVIKEQKPRSADFMLTEEFLNYKRLILSKL